MTAPLERARAVAAVAAAHAVAVDAEARFPFEAVAALKDARLLGAMVPAQFGGDGAPLSEIASICHLLGRHCAATAMVFAMHQIQAACVISHGHGVDWHRQLLQRLAAEQLLLASATTEAGIGGDLGRSTCAIERAGDRFTLDKHGTVISYGAQADGILVTARRSPEAAATDQVLAVVLRAESALDQTAGWDALGMRGTCSNGYRLRADGHADQILPDAYADIGPRTMVPVSHLTWSSLWLGIAADAAARARAALRARMRAAAAGGVSPDALRLADAAAALQQMKALVADGVRRYEVARAEPEQLGRLSLMVALNTLKTSTAELAVKVVQDALLVCGIAGYRNDSEFSVGRHLRDAYSAMLMISNDRIRASTAGLMPAVRLDTDLMD